MSLAIIQSCDVETSSHGNLYGYWHLESVDTINGGVADRSGELVFWSVQAQLIECVDRNNEYSPIIFHFQKQDDNLLLCQAYYNDRERGDPEVVDVTRVYVYGLSSLQPNLHIEHLTSSKLTLSDDTVRLHFKKF